MKPDNDTRIQNFKPINDSDLSEAISDSPPEPLPTFIGDDELVPCPGCGTNHVITGTCQSWRGDKASGFEPDDLRWFQPFRWRRGGAKVQGRFRACLRCGLVWSSVAPATLVGIIEKYGTEEAKERLPDAK